MPRPTRARVDLLRGTLDLMILRTLLPGPNHGHAIAKHIQRTTEDLLQVETGSLYPALYRLEADDYIAATLGKIRQGQARALVTLAVAAAVAAFAPARRASRIDPVTALREE